MAKKKKSLKELSDDELVKLGVKYNRRHDIARMTKWISFFAHVVALAFAPENTSFPILMSNLSCVNLFGILQIVSVDDLNKCKKELESRGSLYKLTQIIEKDQVRENEVGRKVSEIGKEDIRDIGDVFPEFSDNSSYTYRKELVNTASKNNDEQER